MDADRIVEERKTRVFISYAREDLSFAATLCERLRANGFEAFIDQDDIVKGEAWKLRLQDSIIGSDAVVFVLSPDSIDSDTCTWEAEEAERHGKRIFPVILRPVPDDRTPDILRRRQFTFLSDNSDVDKEYAALCHALTEDIEWVREHTHYSERATRWERGIGDILSSQEFVRASEWRQRCLNRSGFAGGSTL
jgi:hypothetical protein